MFFFVSSRLWSLIKIYIPLIFSPVSLTVMKYFLLFIQLMSLMKILAKKKREILNCYKKLFCFRIPLPLPLPLVICFNFPILWRSNQNLYTYTSLYSIFVFQKEIK